MQPIYTMKKKLQFNNSKNSTSSMPAILLQSMTSTPTMDVEQTVAQIKRIVDAGANMVRITTQNLQEAQQLSLIKAKLEQQSYPIPLIADIHYNPKVAELAATLVEKIRINPGNYSDRKDNKTHWTPEEYKEDLDNIKQHLQKLVSICKQHQTTIRIGVNHGSLSDRIMYKYGNTAEGMVESALEFIQIFKELEFNDLVISLKASNVLLMVESNKLLSHRMRDKNGVLPLHLGVTEAGDAEAGRIKSAIGIGVLLAQGIGNTIRVSLTEVPEKEIPVCQKIVAAAHENPLERTESPQLYSRRISTKAGIIGGGQMPIVIQSTKDEVLDKTAADFYYDEKKNTILSLNKKETFKYGAVSKDSINKYIQHKETNGKSGEFLNLSYKDWTLETQKSLKLHPHIILLIKKDKYGIKGIQSLIKEIENVKLSNPLVLRLKIEGADFESFLVQASVQAGAFLLDGQIDGLWLESDYFKTTDTAFGILQASRQRISKTEYIACPSCGRTLFNLQEKLQEIKGLNLPFKGLKIAVMGCKVNGLGEMADADYGYVGSGMGKVDIYKGRTLVLNKVDEAIATQKLLEIITSATSAT